MINSLLVFAQAATVAHWAILLLVIGGVIGIALVVIRQAGITIPPFIITILWIVLAVVIGVLAIKFIMGYV